MTPVEKFAAIGVDIEQKGSVLKLETTLEGCRSVFESIKAADQTLTWNDRSAAHTLLMSEAHSEFSGGTPKALEKLLDGECDLAPFTRALEDFQNSGLRADLETLMQACVKKRKRKFSEHDGEWQMHRRYDLTPFQGSEKRLRPARIITIIADFSINQSATATDIDEYGAILWGISQLIESCGIQTDIRWHVYTNGFAHGEKSKSYDGDITVHVKKPGEYIAPSHLAATFKSLFFRRMGLALMQAAAAADTSAQVGYGYGSAKQRPNAAEFTEGKLHLSSQVSCGYTGQLKAELIKAIKGE